MIRCVSGVVRSRTHCVATSLVRQQLLAVFQMDELESRCAAATSAPGLGSPPPTSAPGLRSLLVEPRHVRLVPSSRLDDRAAFEADLRDLSSADQHRVLAVALFAMMVHAQPDLRTNCQLLQRCGPEGRLARCLTSPRRCD